MKSRLILCFLLLGFVLCQGQKIYTISNKAYQELISTADSCLHYKSPNGGYDYYQNAADYYSRALTVRPNDQYAKEQYCKIWLHSIVKLYCPYCCEKDSAALYAQKCKNIISFGDSLLRLKKYWTAGYYYQYTVSLQKPDKSLSRKIRYCDSMMHLANMKFEKNIINVDTIYYYYGHIMPHGNYIIEDRIQAKILFKNTGTSPLRCGRIVRNKAEGLVETLRPESCKSWDGSWRYINPGEKDTVIVYFNACTFDSVSEGPFVDSLSIGCANCVKEPIVYVKGYLVKNKHIPDKILNKLIKQYVDNTIFHEYNRYDSLAVQQMPQFPGGSDSLRSYIERKTGCRQTGGFDGSYIYEDVGYVVEKDGRISNIIVGGGSSNNPAYITYITNLFMHMPKWVPGKVHGYPARVRLSYGPIFMHSAKK
jgi:hypothetical protein